MLKKFMQNCCCPDGKLGYWILKGMNRGHMPIALWAFRFLPFKDGQKLIDIGCGGGANIARMLKKYPTSVVDGADYSAQSVKLSRQHNAKALNIRCHIYQANVLSLPFPDSVYDGAIASETIYFWPDLELCFREVRRILKTGGVFAIICEMSDPVKGKKWSQHCQEMTIYTPEEIRKALQAAGFSDMKTYTRGVWSMLLAVK